ncbi:DUF4169 family protein [Sneathiella sp.]|uniref:DUF4169 family protein n=1 Tax=Sneathiella sp. TaxID=1964365 RepID=UPI002FE17C31
MGDVVNLNQFRKKRNRKEAEDKARDNRVKYGRTGFQKKLERLENQRKLTDLERKKLTREDHDDDDPPSAS